MHKVKSFGGDAEIMNDELGEVQAVICTYGVVDRDGDVVQKGAIKDGTPVILSTYNHSSITSETLPVGHGFIHTHGNEAVLTAKYYMDTDAGRDAFRTVKNLAEAGLGEWSWGFIATDTEPGELDGKSVNFIKSTSTFEASFVAIGAGINTRTLHAKQRKFTDEGAEVLLSLKSYLSRAADVLAMRRQKGKQLGEESQEILEEIAEQMKAVEDLLSDSRAEHKASKKPVRDPDEEDDEDEEPSDDDESENDDEDEDDEDRRKKLLDLELSFLQFDINHGDN